MKLPSRGLLGRIAWSFGAHGATQGIRLASNVVLARILAPEMFGVMLIVNTLRTGTELLSDIGIGQNVIHSHSGEDRAFLSTAWTIQIARGILLSLVFAIAAVPIANLYQRPDLAAIIGVTASVLTISGFQSVGKFVAQRRQQLRRMTAFEIGVALVSATAQVAISWVYPTVWSLVYGAIFGAIVAAVASFFLTPGLKLRLSITRSHAKEIIGFGKWIFLSSILFFAATNFDRLYLGTAISLQLLGVYGVARSLSEVLLLLVVRIGASIVFPTVAAARDDRPGLKSKLAHARLPLLVGAACVLALFVSLSDLMVFLLYDSRYHGAAIMLPLLGVSVWFGILATLGESVLLGIGRPAYATGANMAKLVWLAVALPIGTLSFGIMGAILAFALGDIARLAPMTIGLRREGLSSIRQDFLLTLGFLTAVLVFRAATGALGITGGLESWLPIYTAFLK